MTKINLVQIISAKGSTTVHARDAGIFVEQLKNEGPMKTDGMDVFVDENAEPWPERWSVSHNAYEGTTLVVHR